MPDRIVQPDRDPIEPTPVAVVAPADLARREAFRREFIARDQKRIVIQSDPVIVTDDVAGGKVGTSKAAVICEANGIAWGQTERSKADGSIYIHLQKLAVLPHELSNVTGVHPVKLTAAEYDGLIPPISASAGLYSNYAHDDELFLDDFSHDEDPLEGQAAWQKHASSTGYLYASGGDCWQHDLTPAYYYCVDSAVTGKGTADYSIECMRRYDATYLSGFHLAGRYVVDTDGILGTCANHATALRIYEAHGGGWNALGTAAGPGTANSEGLLRLEMVGTAFKLYWDGGVEIDVVSGDAPSAENNCGLRVTTGRVEKMLDDFRVLWTAPAAGAFGDHATGRGIGRGIQVGVG